MNPLLLPWTGPYGGVPPFDVVQPSLFPEAFEVAIELRRAEVREVVDGPSAADFGNTIVPLQDAGRALRRVSTLFGVMTSNLSTPEYQALDREWSPKLAAAADEIMFDERLFARVSAVHASRDEGELSAEQVRLVERLHSQLVRAGAQLDAPRKAELSSINQRLAALFAEFSNRVLADENSWVRIEVECDLAGLPDSLRSAYRAAAEERGLDGWVVVNTRSSVDPFLELAESRALRERVWRAFKQRGCNGDAHDTRGILAEIVRLRAARARLLGYASHAHWRMEDTMAGQPERARELMLRVWPAAVARVREEVADMQAVAAAAGDRVTIEPWDYLYYAEKVRRRRYDLDQAELKPYLELSNMIAAAFWAAGQLYGLGFREITGTVPVHHPDVRVWEVTEGERHVGLFYGDYFARAGKRSGAWATTYRSHESFTGTVRTPLAANSNNFVRGAPGAPVLISFDDAETLFHEFGHALHSLLSEVRYPSLGTTPRDFVEYPSQLNERWLLTRPVLDRFARHHVTGEPMPQALLDRIEASAKFNQGYATTEYLAAALLDMDLHTRADGEIDPATYEAEALAAIGMPREVALRHRLTHFSHLFTSDSYSAGYYSYLWSEVMDADTWQAFEQSGDVFDQALARGLREHILAPGNSTDRAEAYRRFRGRDPQVAALLRARGLPPD